MQVVGCEADAAENLAAGGGAVEMQRVDAREHAVTMREHSLEQEVQLLVVPGFVVDAAQDVQPDVSAAPG